MPNTRRSRRLPKPDRERALTLLASSPGGATETMLLAHGFTANLIADLVDAGLATAASQRLGAAGREITIICVRITDAGRQALAVRMR
jgi:hypothetical protein